MTYRPHSTKKTQKHIRTGKYRGENQIRILILIDKQEYINTNITK